MLWHRQFCILVKRGNPWWFLPAQLQRKREPNIPKQWFVDLASLQISARFFSYQNARNWYFSPILIFVTRLIFTYNATPIFFGLPFDAFRIKHTANAIMLVTKLILEEAYRTIIASFIERIFSVCHKNSNRTVHIVWNSTACKVKPMKIKACTAKLYIVFLH